MYRFYMFIFIVVSSLSASSDVVILDFDGAVDPPLAQYIQSGINRAQQLNAELVLITMDTPGGLLSSTKDIVDVILSSSVPVAVFVYPDGARAASAGVFLMMSAHIAAMSPGTHIGAAHPVAIGLGSDTSAVMREKATNDAIAWLRSLAQIRNRNQQWAERAVRYSEAITAIEAESLGIVDIIASNIEELLEKISGDTVTVKDTAVVLHLSEAEFIRIDMSLQQRVLHTLLNPNIAYLLLILGLLGIYFEFQHPGAIFPGVIGVISLLSAIYAFQILPVNYIGILLIIAGIAMFILEVKVPGFGILTSGGIIALLLGSFMLTSGNAPELRINWWTIIPTVAFVALFFIFVVAKALAVQRKKPATGVRGMIGEIGELSVGIPDGKTMGKVLVHGEIWNARADGEIPAGTTVKVKKVDRMVLWVEKVDEL